MAHGNVTVANTCDELDVDDANTCDELDVDDANTCDDVEEMIKGLSKTCVTYPYRQLENWNWMANWNEWNDIETNWNYKKKEEKNSVGETPILLCKKDSL